MMRSRVDLPAPLAPSTPILAPGRNDSEMSSSTRLSGGWMRDSLYIVNTYWVDIEGSGIAAGRGTGSLRRAVLARGSPALPAEGARQPRRVRAHAARGVLRGGA